MAASNVSLIDARLLNAYKVLEHEGFTDYLTSLIDAIQYHILADKQEADLYKAALKDETSDDAKKHLRGMIQAAAEARIDDIEDRVGDLWGEICVALEELREELKDG